METKIDTEQMEILIPFEGCYETQAEHRATEEAYYDWPGYEKAIKADPDGVDFAPEEFWDWFASHAPQYFKKVATGYAEEFFKEIHGSTGIDLKPDLASLVIDSPREYNFTTDRLFVKVSEPALLELYREVNPDLLESIVKKNFTSFDGFMSHYDNSLKSDQWNDPRTWDHNQWGTLLEAIIEQYQIKIEELIWI